MLHDSSAVLAALILLRLTAKYALEMSPSKCCFFIILGALSAPTQEILLKYSLDLPYIQTGICFIEVFANTPYLQGVHHTHISGDHNDP